MFRDYPGKYSSATLGCNARLTEEKSALCMPPLILSAHKKTINYQARGAHFHKASARVSPASKEPYFGKGDPATTVE